MGAVLGLLALVRENALLLALPLAAWPALAFRGSPEGRGWTRRRRLAAVAALVAGLAAVLGPVALRNLAVGGEPALTTAQAGPNFYIGNRIGATGSYTPLRAGRSDTPHERADARELAERALGRPLSAGEVSRYWFGRAVEEIRRRPAAWLRLLATKARLAFHAYEVPDVEDLYLYQRASPALRAAGLVGHLGVLAPLAAAGAVLTWRRRRELWLLHACLAALVAGLVAFYVLARYRFPLVPILALFAGAALAEGWEAASGARPGRSRALAMAAAAAAAVALAVNLPIAAQRAEARALVLSNQGAALVGAGRHAEAGGLYRRALALDPDLAEARLNLGSLLLVGGRAAEAVPHLSRARELVPEDAEVAEQLGVALARAGDPAAGAAELERAVALDPGASRRWRNLAAVYLQAGRRTEARDALSRGLAAVPGDPQLEALLEAAGRER